MGRKGDSLGIVQEIKIWLRKQKIESWLKKEMHEILCDFEIETDNPIFTRRPDLLVLINKKKMTFNRLGRASRP